jgi:cation-transporting P-type ATPase E
MNLAGLTSEQVAERLRQGQGNDIKLATSRTYRDVIVSNVFNPVNIVLYVIGLGLFLVGDTRSAVTTVGLVVINAIIGIYQEIAAKHKLDEIALLARAKIIVRRNGQDEKIDPSEIVLGDVLRIGAGDQIPVDGRLLSDGKIEVDESALTGESDLILKLDGDEVLSGSFCVTGQAYIEATAVGEQSFANNLTRNAREYKTEFTPLQREVNRLLRILLLIVLFVSLLAVLSIFIRDVPFQAWLQVMAVVTGSVSAGLLTLITLNYSWGAVRIGQKGGLVQQLNAIESLSNVTVLCTDKTGTLTANKIRYEDVYPVGISKEALECLLADFAASAATTNKTSQAIIDRLPGQKRPTADDVPFSSARKWSAVAFGAGTTNQGVYALGALEMLEPYFTPHAAARQQADDWTAQGLRVLVFAGNNAVTTLHDATGEPALPPLTLLGIVGFSDELRPHLAETLRAFTDNDIRLKVISGDNPQTVAALARQAGMPGNLQAVSGPELAKMSPGEFSQAAREATVFGRISPQQKEALVLALRDQGEYVAMIGDGVNDVLSLKKANMGIAMESGSSATRNVAAMVLLGDSFEAMPLALTEGQRIVNSIQNILKLFMVTVFALLLLVVAVTILGLGFPFTALQSTLLSFFARGAPPFVLAVTAVATRQSSNLTHSILHFTLPASLTMFLFGLFLYMGVFFTVQEGLAQIPSTPKMFAEVERALALTPGSLPAEQFNGLATLLSAQTALTSFFVYTGILLMIFAEPPTRWFAGGAPYRGKHWLPLTAAIALFVAYLVVLAVPGLRNFFSLVHLPLSFQMGIIATTLLWAVVQRQVWRTHLLARFLDLDDTLPAAKKL